jgi:serine/threonine protein phosphatase PrpC
LQDRIEILRLGNRILIIVADGAGGRSGAARAADFVLRSARAVAASLGRSDDCFRLLHDLDRRIEEDPNCGETTGVVAVFSPDGLFGANVGDSAAWFFAADGEGELSHVRRPYLGSGVAVAHQFERPFSPGTLVVASDGLWKYTSLESIKQRVRTGNPERLAAELAELVRLRSGVFPDDIAIATCRLES